MESLLPGIVLYFWSFQAKDWQTFVWDDMIIQDPFQIHHFILWSELHWNFINKVWFVHKSLLIKIKPTCRNFSWGCWNENKRDSGTFRNQLVILRDYIATETFSEYLLKKRKSQNNNFQIVISDTIKIC